jgi:HTH-type transcriptional regulator/antitoxin HigA
MEKIIQDDAMYYAVLEEVERLMDANVSPDSADGRKLRLLTLYIMDYEKDLEINNLPPNPTEAIKFRMEQQGLRQKDLIPYIGSSSKVSEVLSGKRPLSLKMIRALHEGLGIPLNVLIKESGANRAA